MLRLIVLFILLAPAAHASSEEDVRAFFDNYVEQSNKFDTSIGEMYDANARLISLIDGEDTREMSGTDFKAIIETLMPNAKKQGDTSTYEGIELTPKQSGDGFRLTATRHDALKCTSTDKYYADIARRGGKWQIVEEYSETISLTKCEPSKKLAAALKKLHEGMQAHLPGDIDKDTRLESVELAGSVLTYRQRLFNYTVAELDMAKALPIFQQIAFRAACGSPDMKALVDQGAFIRYESIDRYGYEIAAVDIAPGTCP